jgi:putative SOS response-associated peptidase YedK
VEERPLFAFAGLWTPWHSVRGPKSAPVEGRHELFGFLTTEANAIVAPIHQKAMPVILTTREEADLWLSADTAERGHTPAPLARACAADCREGRERGHKGLENFSLDRLNPYRLAPLVFPCIPYSPE